MNEMPLVSVILPVRNEAGFIERTLRTVFDQTYPHEKTEIIVADGMSSDQTCEIIKRLQAENPNLHRIDNPGQIAATGLNAAILHARGEIVIRVDGHTEIEPDYVMQCVETLKRTKADNVGGKMSPVGHTLFAQAVCLATSTPFGIGGGRFHYSNNEEEVDTVYLGAWRKEIFDRIGFFDENLVRNQDDEFNYRIRKGGGRIVLSPSIKSQYHVRSSASKLWKQYFEYGFWKVRVLQKHPRQMSLRQFVPPFFAAAFLAALVKALFFEQAMPLVLVGGAYALANLTASAAAGAKYGFKKALCLPAIFSILHFSYGTGFLWGLIRFSGKWKK